MQRFNFTFSLFLHLFIKIFFTVFQMFTLTYFYCYFINLSLISEDYTTHFSLLHVF